MVSAVIPTGRVEKLRGFAAPCTSSLVVLLSPRHINQTITAQTVDRGIHVNQLEPATVTHHVISMVNCS